MSYLFLQLRHGGNCADGAETRPVRKWLLALTAVSAGSVAGFAYSEALAKSGIHWDAQQLGRWLTDSNAAVPGSMMNFRQADAAKRQAIIAYLAAPKTQ